ncbi:MAG: hypothetical protein IJS29_03225 [Selenomonadaceae bacterium]|nr:hypothetical protein [Selenomonadaceae bacterium]
MAKYLMFQGTSSHVDKSILTALDFLSVRFFPKIHNKTEWHCKIFVKKIFFPLCEGIKIFR